MIRDKHVDVMLFWGILFVVIGHCYQSQWFFFSAYAFHMPFFFFISGYLFKISEKAGGKASFIVKKIRKQLIPFLLINLSFGIITVIIGLFGIKLGGGLNFTNLFIEPFISNHQYTLNIASWFLVSLFLVNIIAQLINLKSSRKSKIIVFVILIPIALFLIQKGLNNYHDYRLTIVRTGFALLFFQVGVLFKEFKDTVTGFLKQPLTIALLWGAVIFLNNAFGNIQYAIVWGNIGNNIIIVPLITTFLIICISFAICYHISNIVKDNSFIIKIGQRSFFIMVLHLSAFFLVNVVFYWLGKVTIADLSTPYFAYKVNIYFPIYESLGILLPMLFAVVFLRVKEKLPIVRSLR